MSVVSATISSGTKTMDAGYEILSIAVVREVNRIPYAQLELIDGEGAKRKFAVSDSGFFDPGKKIDIKLRYEDRPETEQQVFSGLVVAQSVEAEDQRSVLTVELKDEAIKLTQVPRNQVFAKQTDEQLIKKLIQAQGLKAGNIAVTTVTHEGIVQYGCTDWDFIVVRAELNGLLVCVMDGSLSTCKLEPSSRPPRSVEYGIDEIFAFEIEANGEGQYGEVSSLAWDISNQKMSAARKAKDANFGPGDLDAKTLASVLGGTSRTLTSSAPACLDEMQSWSDATLARSRLGLIRGRISVPGFADIGFLDSIEIKGIGKNFNGKALVTGWRHLVTDQGWITDLRFGLSNDWISSRPDFAARPAAGLLAPVGGLQIGVVAAFEEDPDKQFRVKVKVPALGEDQPAIWARLAAPDAGKGRGFFFRPEMGDEVVVGFFNEDPRQPVIVGALHSALNTPPAGFESLSEKNPLKGLVTRSGTKIGFDDKAKGSAAVYIETAGNNRIRLDDESKSISLADQHGNTLTMDENGITFKSAKDIRLEAKGKLELKSGANMKLDAGGQAEIKGSSVDIK